MIALDWRAASTAPCWRGAPEMAGEGGERKEQALSDYQKKLLQHKEVDAKVRTLRDQVKVSKGEYDKTEDDLKALQSVGQIIGEVLRQLDEERCAWPAAKPAGQQLMHVLHLAAQPAFRRYQRRPGYHSPEQSCVPVSDLPTKEFWLASYESGVRRLALASQHMWLPRSLFQDRRCCLNMSGLTLSRQAGCLPRVESLLTLYL